MRVNVRDMLIGAHFAIPHMVRFGGGSIIDTAADSGLAGDISPDRVWHLERRRDHADQIYRRTAWAARHPLQRDSAWCHLTKQMQKLPVLAATIQRHVLTARLGIPADIAALAAFLAAEESAYITGQTIACDGGHLAHQPQIAVMLDLEASVQGDIAV